MDFITIAIFLGLGALGLIPLLLLVFFLFEKTNRPSGKLKNYKTRFTPSIYASEQIESAIAIFEQEWLKRDPRVTKSLRKLLNKLNIEWEDKKWRRLKKIDGVSKPRIVAAELSRRHTVKIWIGPNMPKNGHNIAYTGLAGALVQATLYNLYGEVDSDIKDYKSLILSVNLKALGNGKETAES